MRSTRSLTAHAIEVAGSTPWLGRWLRRRARRFDEGSVVRIRSGHLAGAAWVRYHRYVNGYWLGHYELPIQQALADHLRPGDVFYDVGANAGFFSLLAATLVGPTGHVFAFDPFDLNVHAIASQRDANGIGNLTIEPKAVAASEGAAAFAFDPDRPATAHLDPAGSEPSVLVPTISLDHFARTARPPSLIKIDVEGAEEEVLRGAVDVLRTMPTVLVELHGPDVARRVIDKLRSRGYRIRRLPHVGRPRQQTHVIAQPDG